MRQTFNFPDRVILLDGSMGQELRMRGVEILNTIWSANALITAPQEVVNVHLDHIAAGADIITTNTYGVIRDELAKEGIEDRFEELNILACQLAGEARVKSAKEVLIAGSLPPLRGSYRPDLVGEIEDILPRYREQARVIAPFVDLILCETMSSANEALAAASAAKETGKPVWVSWTLQDDIENPRAILRSGESIREAFEKIAHLDIEGYLVNCCPPEVITLGIPQLKETGARFIGGYGNMFLPIKGDWVLDGKAEGDGVIGIREDLDAAQYAREAQRWLEGGATVLGGCCGTSPAFIEKLASLIQGQDTL